MKLLESESYERQKIYSFEFTGTLFFNFIFQIDINKIIQYCRVSWPIFPLLRTAREQKGKAGGGESGWGHRKARRLREEALAPDT